MTDATPYTVPQDPGRWRAITLAALVHLALLAFLWIGVRWQNETPTTIEAEVWSPQPKEAAPLPQQTEEPKEEPEPAPVAKEIPKEVPKPEVKEPPVVKPDIALEQAKKRKELEKKRLEDEKQAKLKAEQQKKEQEERDHLAKKKAEEEKRLAKLEEEKKRLEKEKADKAKQLTDAKRKQQEADDKALAKLRDQEMRRLANGVTGTGGAGDAAKSQGGHVDGGYVAKLRAIIRSNSVYAAPEGLEGNPAVEYQVELLPDGSLRSPPRKLKSSGVPGFDEAILRAIEKSVPFPRDAKTGTVQPSVIIVNKVKDQ